MRHLVLLALVLFIGLSVAACGEPSEQLKKVGEKAGETWDAIRTWSYAKKDDLQAWGRKSLDEMKPFLASAQEKAEKSGASATEALREEWGGLQQKFDALKNASADEWDQTRDAFTAAYDAFRKKIGE